MKLEKGTNRQIKSYLRFISEDNKVNMDYFYLESLNREYKKINADEDIEKYLINEALSNNDNDLLLNYSGFNYKHINAALRGTWNYEDNGNISTVEEYQSLGNKIKSLISEHPTLLNDNIIAYRGVNLNYFKQYGIENIEELKALEGNYILDFGFVSTSLKEEKCFFQKENELGYKYNIKIEYMIPKEFKEGIFLDEDKAYNPEQKEYLINSSNLSRVSSVTINADNTAILRATIIPRELYDEYYQQQTKEIGKKSI